MYAKNYKNAIFGLLSRKMLQQVSCRAFLLDRIVLQHSMWYGNVWVWENGTFPLIPQYHYKYNFLST